VAYTALRRPRGWARSESAGPGPGVWSSGARPPAWSSTNAAHDHPRVVVEPDLVTRASTLGNRAGRPRPGETPPVEANRRRRLGHPRAVWRSTV